ncbi:hypothetical protein EI77_00606 [Prosthecobacter fusiformis]|uniref:Outer membrane protein with beta-barrel domain n=1 Tax=Prosthecobacter fusiformis TaxID=48464 RepID=A0A4V3FI71_9BACT|nr:hypothetical protein [Prosthecobacter fusiformis]TDU81303.1 hypothetical protein EI77_00606 [Prosthecobacter fusiformis]
MNTKSLATLSCMLLSSAAFAGTTPIAPQVQPEIYEPVLISYSNVSVGYQYTSADFLGADIDGHGAGIGLEISPVDHLYFAINGSWSDVDAFDVDFDYWTGKAGIGGYIPLTENIHFVTEVGASYANLSLADFDVGTDDWGIYVTPHFRMKFGQFETHIGVTYDSNDLAVTEYSAFARLLYAVSPEMDIYVGANRGLDDNDAFEDVFGLQAGLRFKF